MIALLLGAASGAAFICGRARWVRIAPIQARLLDLNEQLGVQAVAFAARAAPAAT